MTEFGSPNPSDTSKRRRLREDEEEIIRRLSAEAKLRIYEEVKDLLDAKAARDALRSRPTTRSSVAPIPGGEAAARPQAERRGPRPSPSAQDSSDDVLVFSEGGSYSVKGGTTDLDSALDPSRLAPPPRAAGRRGESPAPKARSRKAPAPSAPIVKEPAAEPAAESAAKPADRRFTLLTGLTPEQVRLLRNAGSRQKFEEGETIYSPGDKAEGAFIILRGRVEITPEEGIDAPVSTRRSGEWFGELEVLTSLGTRHATAHAARPTSLFEISGNPLELFRWISDRKAAMRLLRNSICLMSRHLREIAEADEGIRPLPLDESAAGGPASDWEKSLRLLPPGLLARAEASPSFTEARLLDGQTLYREGDAPDGLYFIQGGTLDVFRRGSRSKERKLASLQGPLIIGDVSFFSHQNRSVTLRAFGPVRLLRFSGDRFDRVRKRNAEETLDLLMLCAELAAGFMLVRQNRTTA